jgi:hypothetical protein
MKNSYNPPAKIPLLTKNAFLELRKEGKRKLFLRKYAEYSEKELLTAGPVVRRHLQIAVVLQSGDRVEGGGGILWTLNDQDY